MGASAFPAPTADTVALVRRAGAVSALSGLLAASSELVRAGAARCLGHLADPAAAPALVGRLLDQDEDVRADAMAALERCARSQDGPALLASLEGDPVLEVKTAAIRTLAALGDKASLPRLRALVRDRCADEVAWDDDNGYWDDWLDVQAEAIEALGTLGASEAVRDILTAREDEMGQSLDDVAFAALSQLPEGPSALVALLRNPDQRTRAQALSALSRVAADLLVPVTDRLLADPEAAVRKTAVRACAVGAERLAELALNDPDESVRLAALVRLGDGHDAVMVSALADPAESNRARALDLLSDRAAAELGDDLAANLEAWAMTAGSALAASAIRRMPTICPERAHDVLRAIAEEADRPLPVRLAALETIGAEPAARAVDVLTEALARPSRQMRAVACAALARSAATTAPYAQAARTALLEAISQRIEPSSVAPAATGADAATPKLEAEEAALKITPSGEIVRDDSALPQASGAVSTLAMLRQPAPASPDATLRAADDQPNRPARSARRRVSVEGDGGDPLDLAAAALQASACLADAAFEAAIRVGLGAPEPQLQRAAATAAARRADEMQLAAETAERLADCLASMDPVVRLAAARAVSKLGGTARRSLYPLLADTSATVRAVAVEALAAEDASVAADALLDGSQIVALAAARSILATADRDRIVAAFERCRAAARPDPAAALIAGSMAAAERAVGLLTLSGRPDAEVLPVLAALERATERPAASAPPHA